MAATLLLAPTSQGEGSQASLPTSWIRVLAMADPSTESMGINNAICTWAKAPRVCVSVCVCMCASVYMPLYQCVGLCVDVSFVGPVCVCGLHKGILTGEVAGQL
jgi:hypothetical protein